MKWWPSSCKAGDMIRSRCGSVYHYGIFVSEDEVIQFGPPPTVNALSCQKEFCVISTDIDFFSNGSIVEIAYPETREEKKRFSPSKTVKLAKGRLGESGYDIIHNNCEHFVYECVYGVKRCTQAEEARLRWYSRPILNVYILPFDDSIQMGDIYPRERKKEIDASSGALRYQRYATWKALDMGLSHAFGVDMRKLSFKKSKYGRWSCDKYFFSLSHTKRVAVVAVSNSEVGVDTEMLSDISHSYLSNISEAFCRDVFTDRERGSLSALDEEELVAMWTRKESAFKCRGTGEFSPLDYTLDAEDIKTGAFLLDGERYILSVCGEKSDMLCVYLLGEEHPCRIELEKLKIGSGKI